MSKSPMAAYNEAPFIVRRIVDGLGYACFTAHRLGEACHRLRHWMIGVEAP